MTAIQPGRRRAPHLRVVPEPMVERRAALPAAARPMPFTMIWVATASLCMIGLVMVSSAASWVATKENSPWEYLLRQCMWVGLGAVALLLALRIPMHVWRDRLVGLMLVIALGLNLLVVVPGNPLATEVLGATRWISLGPLSFQPSELAKPALIMFLALLFWRRPGDRVDPRLTVYPAVAVFAAFAFLLVRQDDLGTNILLAVILLSMLWLAGVPARWVMGTGISLASLGVAAILFLEDFRMRRILGFLDPQAHEGEAAYQMGQSRIGLATGGLIGVGLGNSRAKWGFLPFAHSDFILAVVGEEFGLLGVLSVIVLFMMLILGGVRAGLRARDRFSRLVAFGICTWIAVQAAINIGVAVGTLPTKGITLPFVSYGGTSLMITMFAMGVLLRIASEAEDGR